MIRFAISFWNMPTSSGIRSRWSIILKNNLRGKYYRGSLPMMENWWAADGGTVDSGRGHLRFGFAAGFFGKNFIET